MAMLWMWRLNAPVQAQVDPFPPKAAISQGDSGVEKIDELQQHEAEQVLEAYADCVVRSGYGYRKTLAMIRLVPNSAPMQKAAFDLSDEDCLSQAMKGVDLSSEMRMRADTLRAALLTALYRRDFGRRQVMDLSTVPPIKLSEQFGSEIGNLPVQYRAERALSDCVVRADRQDSHRLLTAKPWTPAEDSALASLMPALRGCISTSQTISLKRHDLRGYLGETLYELSSTARNATASAVPGTR